MRPFIPTLLSLSLCVLALGDASAADAKTRHRVHRKTPAAAAAKAPVHMEDLSPLVFYNADGSPRAPTIDDAPTDDYLRVAWCYGVLTGDMELAEQIGPLEPVDERIQTIGRSYLRAYEAALTLSGKGGTEAGHTSAEIARKRGYDGWDGARRAEIRKAAYAYDTWQLPGDCEHAAVRLSGHPNLFAEMATEDETVAINAALNSGGPHSYAELPKPKLTAQTAPQDADAAISTNTLGKRVTQSATLPAIKPQDPPAPATQPKGVSATKPS